MENKSVIRTVTGDVHADALGYCQCHEHIYVCRCNGTKLEDALLLDDYGKSLNELKIYKKAGGAALVDAQPVGCGRNARWLVRASKGSDVKIIAVTGFHKLQFYDTTAFIYRWRENELRQLFIDDVALGMQDGHKRLDARAGMVKMALDAEGIYADMIRTKLFCAAADAAAETGAPLFVHTDPGADVFSLLTFAQKYGIVPQRIIVCHLDRTRPDIGYHKELAAEGVYLEYDSINRNKYISNEQQQALVYAMVQAGYIKQLLFGLDTTRSRMKHYGGNMGLDYIMNIYVPQLMDKGLSLADLQVILVRNPMQAIALHG